MAVELGQKLVKQLILQQSSRLRGHGVSCRDKVHSVVLLCKNFQI
jgi:hypothetical protein